MKNGCFKTCLSSVLSSSVIPVPAGSSDNQWSTQHVSFMNADFNKFFTHALEPLEQGLCMHCCSLYGASKGEKQLQDREYIFVGTAFAVPGESEPSRGRILVFKLDRLGTLSERGKGASVAVDYDTIDDYAMYVPYCYRILNFVSLIYHACLRSVKEGEDDTGDTAGQYRVSLISERETNGAVLSLATTKGRLVAGINSKLQLFKWNDGSDNISMPELKSECGHHGHLLAVLLKSRGDILALGDILQSITMLRFNEESAKLEEIARDFSCNYMRSIEIIDENTFVAAEDNENIFFAHRDASSKASESGRLEICGEFHVGELINVFQHGTLSNRPLVDGNALVAGSSDDQHPLVNFTGSKNQSILFGTVSGTIGTILSIDESTYNLFQVLQKYIQTVVHGVGGLPHNDWRNFSNEKKYGGQNNTIDGDLIELFLELTPSEMKRVTSLLNDELLSSGTSSGLTDSGVITVDVIRSRIEEISRCH